MRRPMPDSFARTRPPVPPRLLALLAVAGSLAGCASSPGPAAWVSHAAPLPLSRPALDAPGLARVAGDGAAPASIALGVGAPTEAPEGQWVVTLPAGPDWPQGPIGFDGSKATTLGGAVTTTVPVRPGVPVRVAVRVDTSALAPRAGSGGAGLVVLERDAQGEALLRHDRAERVVGTANGRSIEAVITPGARTDHLEIQLQPARGRARGRATFRDLTVETVDPLTAAGPVVPSSLAEADRARRVTRARSARPSLLARPGEEWGGRVPAGTAARFRVAVAPLAAEGRTCVAVVLDQDDVWSDCLDAGDRWHGVDVAVPRVDHDATLSLRVAADAPGPVAWGDPLLDTGADPTQGAPDLALIVLDTLRADHLGAWGHARSPTSPGLDGFAGRAVRFADARAPSGWTAASLGSVVTGELPARHGAGARRERGSVPPSTQRSKALRKEFRYGALRAELPTVGERLRAQGYDTRGLVSNGFFGPTFGFARGFSSYKRYNGNGLPGARRGVEQALAYLDGLPPRAERRPYFLVFHVVDPHHPYRLRAPLEDRFPKPADLDLRRVEGAGQEAWVLDDVVGTAREQPDQVRTLYEAEIRYMDDALAPLLARLEGAGAGVVVLSDHGEGFAEHGRYIHGNSLYEELLRVPLVVRWPDGRGAGQVVEETVGLQDVAPTLVEMAGAAALPDGIAGKALTPDPLDGSRRVFLHDGMYSGPDRYAVVDGDWKAVLTPTPLVVGEQRLHTGKRPMAPAFEIYDLAQDPGEQRDRAGDAPAPVQARLRSALDAYLLEHIDGLHVRCVGSPHRLRVTSDREITRVLATAGRTKSARLDATREVAHLQAGPDPETGWLVRFRHAPEALAVVVDGAEQPLAPGGSADSPDGRCTVRWVDTRAAGVDVDVSADDLEGLEALGYME